GVGQICHSQPDQGGVGGVGGGLSALGCGVVVGPRRSTASVRTGGHAFAPGAGAPTGRSWDWLCCRSTALGAKGVGTHSHPGRVPLRVGVGFGSVVGAPPRCERVGHGANRAELGFGSGLKFRGRAPTSCPVALFSECLACSVYRLSCCWEQLCLPRL